MGESVRKIVAALACMLLISVGAYAQRTVKMVLQDSQNGEPVAFATVSLTKKGADKPVKYVLSDDKGEAVIERVASAVYVLKAELLGYKSYSSEIEMKKDPIDLGIIKMEPDREVLDAASVTAVGNPIVVKKDTVEYNASSFKTTDNDMLVDLLKKLPGVEVNEDGSVTANGQTISKITIDGKTFFLDDPQLATKNIPAKVIEKVKVLEKKSEQAEFTGISDGNEETVIDLSIRPGMMNGMFGNVMAGAGHDVPSKESAAAYGNGDWRFQGAGFLGRFTKKNQISLILNGNNTNNRGFNDLAGSMMQGMRGGGGGMGRGQGGWGSGNGITTSWMAGLNGQTYLFDDKMDLQGNYLYNGSSRFVEEQSSKITYLDGGDQLIYKNGINNPGRSYNDTWGHRFGARVEHKFSENTSILFQPQFNFGGGRYLEAEDFETRRVTGGVESLVSDGFTRNLGESSNWQANGFFLYRQRLGIPGRTLSFNARYNFSNTDMNGFNQSKTDSHDANPATVVNQRFDQNSKNSSLSGRLTYTEPLGAGFYVEANYEISWALNQSWKNTFNALPGTSLDFSDAADPLSAFNRAWAMSRYVAQDPESAGLDDIYSNTVLNRSLSHRAGANFMYQNDALHAQVGASFLPTTTHNETKGYDAYDRTVYNWAPSAMFWYDFDDNSNVRFFYWGRSNQPSTSQLMPVLDNSNPLNVSLGNPYLDPYFNHGFRGDFRYTNKKTFLSLNAGLDGNINQSPIVSATWYDMTNGAQYSMPVNGHASGNVNARIFLNTPIAKSNFSIFSMTRFGYSNSSSYLGSNAFSMDTYKKTDGTFDYAAFNAAVPDIDKDDRFTLNTIQSINAAQRIRLTYRNDFVELTAGGRTRMSKSWYTISSAATNTTWNNQVQASMNWTIPGGIGLISDVDYNWYRGYTTAQPSEVIWNAEITKLLFKNQMTVSLKAYDILNQAKNLTVTDASNYHQETYNNTLGRYIILSVTWRFGTFGDMRGAGGPMGGRGGRGGFGGGGRRPF